MTNNTMIDVNTVLDAFNELAEQNNWRQYHSAENLAVALNVEAAELLREFQWQPERVDRNKAGAEIADVLMYAIALCDKLGLDAQTVLNEKIAANRQRFGVTFDG